MDLRVSRPSPSTLAVPETRRGSAKREIPWVLLSRGVRSSGFWVWYLKGVSGVRYKCACAFSRTNIRAHISRLQSKSKRAKEQPQSVRYPRLTIYMYSVIGTAVANEDARPTYTLGLMLFSMHPTIHVPKKSSHT
ncbi:hypothetical protein KQX54_005912 [Cotesia glomerata]|uniref:Uncharacterized protein n=1 Tax=Cotesia glomerata TaxID=32391 RepID=A0AAV7IJV2_COTGL|nr:hypothetical protein KQX54_005912 [Cotesia glomerata]